MNLDVEDFIERLEEEGLEPYSYSGRFMYGKNCVAVDFENLGSVLAAIFNIGFTIADNDESDDGYTHMLEDTRTDMMGVGMVAYWPNAEWPEGRESLR